MRVPLDNQDHHDRDCGNDGEDEQGLEAESGRGQRPENEACDRAEANADLGESGTCAARGATLGNDVNLRDVEGRSALLLGKAKDNNASSAIGPFIRLFHNSFTLETLRAEEISLTVQGADGYRLEGRNKLSRISRPFEELIGATIGTHHQYPDGFALYTGTLFAPTQDRDAPGLGFTHKPGDVVTISSPHLGSLMNTTKPTSDLAPWTFGIRDLTNYLSRLYLDGQAVGTAVP